MSKARSSLTVAVAVVSAVLFSAQTPSGSREPAQVTVKGCVERATRPTAEPGASTATTAAPGPDTTYVLVNVTTSPSSTGMSGADRKSLVDARSYRLDDSDESELSNHVGHTVEITGTLERQDRSTVGTTGSADTATTDAIAPKLKVATIRLVSENCSKD